MEHKIKNSCDGKGCKVTILPKDKKIIKIKAKKIKELCY